MSAVPALTDPEMLVAFRERRRERLERNWRASYVPKNPIASDLHDCLRYMVGRQVAYLIRPVPELDGLQAIENGEVKEEPIRRQLQDEGWRVIHDQQRVEIYMPVNGVKTLIMSGNTDGEMGLEGWSTRDYLLLELKDTAYYTIDNIETEDDLRHSIWNRKWRRQVTAYCLAENKERGALVLGHRGQRKLIIVHLEKHLDDAEQMLKNCEQAVAIVADFQKRKIGSQEMDAELNKMGVPYLPDWDVCKTCWLRDRACFPPSKEELVSPVMREDLEDEITEYMEAKPSKRLYDRTHKKLRELSAGIDLIIAGRWLIEGKWGQRDGKASWSMTVRHAGERK